MEIDIDDTLKENKTEPNPKYRPLWLGSIWFTSNCQVYMHWEFTHWPTLIPIQFYFFPTGHADILVLAERAAILKVCTRLHFEYSNICRFHSFFACNEIVLLPCVCLYAHCHVSAADSRLISFHHQLPSNSYLSAHCVIDFYCFGVQFNLN